MPTQSAAETALRGLIAPAASTVGDRHQGVEDRFLRLDKQGVGHVGTDRTREREKDVMQLHKVVRVFPLHRGPERGAPSLGISSQGLRQPLPVNVHPLIVPAV